MDAFNTLQAFLVQLPDQVVNTFLCLTEYDGAWLTTLRLQLTEKLDKPDILLFNRTREHLLLYRWICADFFLADLDAREEI